ncbi:hypothetical protein F7C95_04500 [Opitutia bacterium ISCC 51]|nr:hypothetical protein F7C95_04500 [Opitutae bacterium ISCC 51]QXD29238.1 hypothetical protein GA003_04480 [Opitutae bacterium ISCC 52]
MKLFEKLFNKDKSASSRDGLSQDEREAIIDLLILGAYTDNRLSLREEKAFEALTETLSWESETELSDFMKDAIAKVRSVRSNPSAKEDLLIKVKERLNSLTSVKKALNLLNKVFISDGRSYDEANFYREVESLLKKK